MNLVRLWLVAVLFFLAAGLALSGCGEKIAIPEPQGLYSGSAYRPPEEFSDPDGPLQLTIANNTLLVLTPGALTKRDQNYGYVSSFEGLDNPRSLCVNESQDIVFVFQQGGNQVSWFSTNDLTPMGSSDVPAVQDAIAMATSSVGIEQVPGADTYLYLSDPDSLVIHRYAFDEINGLQPHGILARSGGDAARFVHQPAGLARDSQDSLLVCDADTNRNWVIRFNSYPDSTDTAPDDGPDPLRGRASLWADNSGCVPHPAADYVLGNASDCGETGWVGGTSSEAGEFNTPSALAIDGSGRVFVADTGNSRIQVFDWTGEYALLFGNPNDSPLPVSLGVVDIVKDPANNVYNYAAYVYVILEGADTVLKFTSNDQANDEGLPPPNDLP